MPERTPAAYRLVGPLALVLLVGCAGGAESTTVVEEVTVPPASPEAATFDLALVKSNFTEECASPIIVDDLFCQQVDIDGMTAEGTTLIVPTFVNATGMEERSAVICDQVAIAHFDGASGEPLGFDTITILDRDDDEDATCVISE